MMLGSKWGKMHARQVPVLSLQPLYVILIFSILWDLFLKEGTIVSDLQGLAFMLRGHSLR